ncbi:MAG: NADPH-dependent F420 reductase [Chloroflexota bacterium]
MKIAILGGTGREGAGLGVRWAAAGHQVIIGSRLAERAEQAAAELNALLPGDKTITGTDNLSAAHQAELVVLAVPYEAQAATLDVVKGVLAGKILLTVVAPLGNPRSQVWHPPAGSAAQEAQQQLGSEVRVVAAFQGISAEHLKDLQHNLDSDVLVCGDKLADREVVIRLAQAAGLRGVHAGPLANAGVMEGLTAVLIAINGRYKTKDAGIRITGLP